MPLASEKAADKRRSVFVQLAILAGLTVGFAISAALLAPPNLRWLSFVGPAAVIITERLADSFGPRANRSPAEPIALAVAAVGIFVWPVANRETPHSVTVLGLALAVLVQAAWAVRRYSPGSPRPGEPWLVRVRAAVRVGLAYAAFFGILAAVLTQFGGESSDRPLSLPVILAAYIIGGILTGVVAGSGRHLTRWPLGAMLIGVIGAIPAFLTILLLLPLLRADTMALSATTLLGLSCAVSALMGPAAGLILSAQWSDADPLL